MDLVHAIILSVFFVAGGAEPCVNGTCRPPSQWTLEEAVSEIQKIYKQLDDARIDRDRLRRELNSTGWQLIDLRNNRVPLGYTYIQFYGQPSPLKMWPSIEWEDISSTYAGLFFRVLGGASAEWGVTQTECAPRITHVETRTDETVNYPNRTDIPANGWSDFVGVGHSNALIHTNGFGQGLRFYTSGCEVRPTNQAIRIWKRIEYI